MKKLANAMQWVQSLDMNRITWLGTLEGRRGALLISYVDLVGQLPEDRLQSLISAITTETDTSVTIAQILCMMSYPGQEGDTFAVVVLTL